MGYGIVIVLAYLLGCSNLAYYLAKWKKKDIKGNGTGNYGASNAAILMGWGSGIAVGIHDIGKAALAVVLAGIAFPALEYAGAVAGVACVLGHIFPFYLKFKGGKGFASFIGMTAALNWKLALVIGIVIVVVTLVTDYLVAGTVTTIISVPVYLGISTQSVILPLIILVATAVIIYKHRENFVRIYKGTEIGLRATIKGKNRI